MTRSTDRMLRVTWALLALAPLAAPRAQEAARPRPAAPATPSPSTPAMVEITTPVAVFPGPAGAAVGESLASVGDVEVLGAVIPHALVAAGNPTVNASFEERVIVLSPNGACGPPCVLLPPLNGICFGKSLDAQDITGDGIPEILVGGPCGDDLLPAPLAEGTGLSVIFDGASSSLLGSHVQVGAKFGRLGSNVAFVDDMVGGPMGPDGTADYAVASLREADGVVTPFVGDNAPDVFGLGLGLEADPGCVIVEGGAGGGQAVQKCPSEFPVLPAGPVDPRGMVPATEPVDDTGNSFDLNTGLGQSAGPGLVNVYSGLTGALHFSVAGDQDGDRFGAAIASVGATFHPGLPPDMGVPDLVIGAPDTSTPPVRAHGAVYLVAGETGLVMHKVEGTTPYANVGLAVARVGHVDANLGDPSPDFVTTWRTPGVPARVLSGSDGSVLRPIPLPPALAGNVYRPATHIVALDDLNCDGVREVAIRNAGAVLPHVQVADPVTGDTLFVIRAPGGTDCFPGPIANVGNLGTFGAAVMDRAELAVADSCDGTGGRIFIYSFDAEPCTFDGEADPGEK